MDFHKRPGFYNLEPLIPARNVALATLAKRASLRLPSDAMPNPNPTFTALPLTPLVDQHPSLSSWIRRRGRDERAPFAQIADKMLRDAGNTPRAAMLIIACLTADALVVRASKRALRTKASDADIEVMDSAMRRQREAWAAYDAEVERVRAAADGLLGFDV